MPACCGRYAKEPHVLRISIANGYVQVVCWVFVRSLLPYAAAHAMGSNSSTAAAQEAHETGSAGELQGYAVTQHARSAPACSPLGAHVGSHPPPRRPSRSLAAARWAREESPRHVAAEEGPRRRPPKVADVAALDHPRWRRLCSPSSSASCLPL